MSRSRATRPSTEANSFSELGRVAIAPHPLEERNSLGTCQPLSFLTVLLIAVDSSRIPFFERVTTGEFLFLKTRTGDGTFGSHMTANQSSPVRVLEKKSPVVRVPPQRENGISPAECVNEMNGRFSL